MRDLTMGAFGFPEDYKTHKFTIEMDVYTDGYEELDIQEFAQFMRMVLNEWTNDYGFYKRPRSINGVPVIEDTTVCPQCNGKTWTGDESSVYYHPCEYCGMAGEVYDTKKIYKHLREEAEHGTT